MQKEYVEELIILRVYLLGICFMGLMRELPFFFYFGLEVANIYYKIECIISIIMLLAIIRSIKLTDLSRKCIIFSCLALFIVEIGFLITQYFAYGLHSSLTINLGFGFRLYGFVGFVDLYTKPMFLFGLPIYYLTRSKIKEQFKK